MTDPTNKVTSNNQAIVEAQNQARTKALEEDRRKHIAAHVEPARAAHQAQQTPQATGGPEALQASHREAARTHEAGRSFQQWSQTQANHAAPHLDAAKAANTEEALKVADLKRARDPAIKG